MSGLPSLPSILAEFARTGEGFVAYTGAGISIAAPSCAPNWWSLTQEIMKSFFEKCDKEWLPADFNTAGGLERQPEIMFENFGNMLGTQFYEVFRCLDFGEPNDTHRVIALLAKAGIMKACFTTNFDIYIERALQAAGVEYDRLIDNHEYDQYEVEALFDKTKKPKFLLCKIHGTVDIPDSIVSTASVYRSSKGFAPPKSRILNFLLERIPCLFLGYSGWDYEHENYRKYWENIGPKVRTIYWNRRPGEVGGPKFDEIFSTLKSPIIFCEGDLPDGLVASIPHLNSGSIEHALATADAWDRLKVKRLGFLEEWAASLSRVRMMGLVLTDINLFTDRLKKVAEAYKEKSENQVDLGQTGDATAAYTAKLMALSADIGSGKITMDEYMVLQEEASMDFVLFTAPPNTRDYLKDLIKKNAYPGITDSQTGKTSLIATVPHVAKRYGGDIQKATEAFVYMQKFIDEAESLPQEEKTLETTILYTIRSIMHEEDRFWKPYWEELKLLKRKIIDEKRPMEEFTEGQQKILKRANDAMAGIDFDFEEMLQHQRDEVCKLFEAGKTAEGTSALEGYVMTCFLVGHQDTQRLFSCKEYREFQFNMREEPVENLQAFDNYIRRRQGKLLEVVEQQANGEWTPARILLELLLLKQWAAITEYCRVPNYGKYEMTDPRYSESTHTSNSGRYLLHAENRPLYDFLYGRVSQYLDRAWQVVPGLILQKIGGAFVMLAEFGRNLELDQKVTDLNLKISDGVVNQQTPPEIPLSLASFLEEKGRDEEALHYYLLSLDAIKFYSPPMMSDIMLYRSALLTHKVKNDKKKAILIVGKYHPKFTGNASPTKLAARRLALELAEELSKELGFPSVEAAVEALIKGEEATPEQQQMAEEQAKKEAEEKAKKEAEEQAKKEAEKAKKEAEEKAKKEAEDKAKLEAAEEQAKQEAEEKAKKEAEEKVKKEAEEKAKLEAEEQVKKEAEEKAAAEQRAKQEAEERAKKEAEERAKREAEERARQEAEQEEAKAPQERVIEEIKEIADDTKREIQVMGVEVSQKIQHLSQEIKDGLTPDTEKPAQEVNEPKLEVIPVKDMSGWMSKLSVNFLRKTFQKRYFVFVAQNHTLKWAKDESDNERNFIETQEIVKIEPVPKSEYQRDYCFTILTKKKNYVICAEYEADYREWLQNLQNELLLWNKSR